jgi:hypothetical protein
MTAILSRCSHDNLKPHDYELGLTPHKQTSEMNENYYQQSQTNFKARKTSVRSEVFMELAKKIAVF